MEKLSTERLKQPLQLSRLKGLHKTCKKSNYMEENLDTKPEKINYKSEGKIKMREQEIQDLIKEMSLLTAKPIELENFPKRKEKIETQLSETEKFIKAQISSPADGKLLKKTLTELETIPFLKIKERKYPYNLQKVGNLAAFLSSKDHSDTAFACRDCADLVFWIESLQILVDAKLNGNSGLAIGCKLAEDRYGTVYTSTTIDESGKKKKVALKECVHEKRINVEDIINSYNKRAKEENNFRDAKKENEFLGIKERFPIYEGEAIAKVTPQMSQRMFYGSGIAQRHKSIVGSTFGCYIRNIATTKFQSLFSEHGAPKVLVVAFAAESDGKAYIGMDLIDGKTIEDAIIAKEIKIDAEYLKSSTWIQICDCFLGQMDRHIGNVMITTDGRITAIDHDFAFPIDQLRTVAKDLPEVLRCERWTGGPLYAVDKKSPRNFAFPPVIDVDMYNAIIKMTTEERLVELEQQYEDCGLTKEEIEPARKRATAIRGRALNMKEDPKKCINSTQWLAESTLDQLKKENSYAKTWLWAVDDRKPEDSK